MGAFEDLRPGAYRRGVDASPEDAYFNPDFTKVPDWYYRYHSLEPRQSEFDVPDEPPKYKELTPLSYFSSKNDAQRFQPIKYSQRSPDPNIMPSRPGSYRGVPDLTPTRRFTRDRAYAKKTADIEADPEDFFSSGGSMVQSGEFNPADDYMKIKYGADATAEDAMRAFAKGVGSIPGEATESLRGLLTKLMGREGKDPGRLKYLPTKAEWGKLIMEHYGNKLVPEERAQLQRFVDFEPYTAEGETAQTFAPWTTFGMAGRALKYLPKAAGVLDKLEKYYYMLP